MNYFWWIRRGDLVRETFNIGCQMKNLQGIVTTYDRSELSEDDFKQDSQK